MKKLRLALLVSAIVFLVLSILNAANYAGNAIRGLQDVDYFYNQYATLLEAFRFTEEEGRMICSFLPGYFIVLAVLEVIGVFLDVFYIQSCRRNFPIKRGLFIALGIAGIIFSQIVPGIIFIILGARYGGKSNDDIIDNPENPEY